MEDVKCPKCKEEGLESTISFDSYGSMTLLEHFPFADSKGHFHDHDPNEMVRNGRCSNGHMVIMTSYQQCPACDYGKIPKLTYDGTVMVKFSK